MSNSDPATVDPLKRQEKKNATPTTEVGSEGGSPGDVEVVRRNVPGKGSEAGDTYRPVHEETETIDRDTGEGRRSPT